MISLLIRLVMGKSAGGFWTGLVMVLAGVGLTVVSYMLAASLGGVAFVFYGLIIAGIVRMILSAPTLRTGGSRGYSGYAGSRPYMTGAPGYQTGGPAVLPYAASPAEAQPGHCWLCGGRVKHGATICLHCGASLGAPQQDSEIAQAAGYSVTGSSLVVPPMQPSMPPPSAWRYQPAAPQPRGPYSPPEPPYGPYPPPEQPYGPYSVPEPQYDAHSAPKRRRRSRSAPEMPLRMFEPPARPRRPPRSDSYADDDPDWGPPPPRGGRRY